MGIREFSYPAGVSWAGADWCLNRILAAGEGSIAGDWEDSCWKIGPPTLAVSLPPSTPIPAIGKPSAQRQHLEGKGTHVAAGALGTGWEHRPGPARRLARFHGRQMAACEGVRA